MTTNLAKDEQIKREDTFTANLILLWLKANFTLTNKRVTGNSPNTFFGIIPLGSDQIAQPLKTIASVSSSTQFYFKRLLLGIILLLVGFFSFGSSVILGAVLAVLGLINIVNCYTAAFVITNNAGQDLWYEVSIRESSKVKAFVNEVNMVIAEI